ncbi:MAG: heme exporter protein CcmB [Porticoccaceae bacterium]|nr:heme exporter protein CcmB [Porticoccaceae bacterium]MDG1474744.1 heme exporter protein CcmB [Porticoccaceae bacterium]
MNGLIKHGFFAHLRHDLRLINRRRGEVASPLIFFVIAATLIPLGVSPEARVLSMIAPGIIWVMALLATLLSADRLFDADYNDGSLEQILISPQLLVMPVLGKIAAHWLTTGLPLTLVSPLLGLLFSLPSEGYGAMMAGLAIGTCCLSLLVALGAALTVSLKNGGLLLTLIVMPLYMPVLIFGTATAQYSIDGLAWDVPLAVLAAMLTMAIALCPIAIAGILRLTTMN